MTEFDEYIDNAIRYTVYKQTITSTHQTITLNVSCGHALNSPFHQMIKLWIAHPMHICTLRMVIWLLFVNKHSMYFIYTFTEHFHAIPIFAAYYNAVQSYRFWWNEDPIEIYIWLKHHIHRICLNANSCRIQLVSCGYFIGWSQYAAVKVNLPVISWWNSSIKSYCLQLIPEQYCYFE